MVLLCRQMDEDSQPEPLMEVPIEQKIDYAEFTIHQVIKMFVDAILIFYELED